MILLHSRVCRHTSSVQARPRVQLKSVGAGPAGVGLGSARSGTAVPTSNGNVTARGRFADLTKVGD